MSASRPAEERDNAIPAEIIGRDSPARKLDRDAFGKPAIGRDQRGHELLRLDRLAQRESNGESLAPLVFRLDHGYPLEAFTEVRARERSAGRPGERPPGVRRLGRAHRLREKPGASRERQGRLADLLDLFGPDADAIEQAAQRKLGVARRRLVTSEQRPGMRVETAVEAGQDDRAVLEASDARDELRGRCDRTRRADRDDRMAGSFARQALGVCAHEAAVTIDGVEAPAFGEQAGPVLARDGEEGRGNAPHLLEVARVEPRELPERHGFEMKRVDEAREITRERDDAGSSRSRRERLIRLELQGCPIDRAAPARDELGEQQEALRLADCRPDLDAGRGVGEPTELQRIGFAERQDARQRRGPAA